MDFPKQYCSPTIIVHAKWLKRLDALRQELDVELREELKRDYFVWRSHYQLEENDETLKKFCEYLETWDRMLNEYASVVSAFRESVRWDRLLSKDS